MIAKLAADVSIGSDFHANPMEGTLTAASRWHSARVPVNRNCFAGLSYWTGSPVDFQTILKVIRAGVAIESIAKTRRRNPHREAKTEYMGHLWGDVLALFVVAGVLALLTPRGRVVLV